MTSTQVYLTLDGDHWRCVRTPDGRTQQFIGCRHLNPADARRHRAELALRAPAVAPDPPSAPPLGKPVGAIAGVREGTPATGTGGQ